jgi:hypothetical protein
VAVDIQIYGDHEGGDPDLDSSGESGGIQERKHVVLDE